MRFRALSLALVALAAAAPAAATAASAPVRVELSWDGGPCNAAGALIVRVVNVGATDLALPKAAIVGEGGLVIARVWTGGAVTGSVGDEFNRQFYSAQSLEGPHVAVLRPGEGYAYRVRVYDQADIYPFSRAYAAMRRDGGRIGVLWDPLESTCRHASLSIL